LKDIEWNENYSSEKYTGPAVKVQAGVLGQEVYESANERGYAVVGGSCPVSHFLACSKKFSHPFFTVDRPCWRIRAKWRPRHFEPSLWSGI